MLRARIISVYIVLSTIDVSSGEYEKKDKDNEKEHCWYGVVYGNSVIN